MVIKQFPLIILLLCIGNNSNSAQDLGFGCLGLVGGFGGYTTQTIQTEEVNEFIHDFNRSRGDSLAKAMGGFKNLTGFRLGLNIFRQNIEGLVITFKGFYENLLQRNTAAINTPFAQENSFTEIALKNFGIGFDVGTSLSRSVSWKVLDASIIFHRLRFTTSLHDAAGTIIMNQYNAVESPIGYTMGTGFIIELIDQYVTLEGSAGYMFLNVKRVQTSAGKLLTTTQTGSAILENVINSGGLNASIQVNIGVPF